MNNRIRDLREDAEFTQAQIASYLNMSQTGYSKYETGENDIPTAVWKYEALSVRASDCESPPDLPFEAQ